MELRTLLTRIEKREIKLLNYSETYARISKMTNLSSIIKTILRHKIMRKAQFNIHKLKMQVVIQRQIKIDVFDLCTYMSIVLFKF